MRWRKVNFPSGPNSKRGAFAAPPLSPNEAHPAAANAADEAMNDLLVIIFLFLSFAKPCAVRPEALEHVLPDAVLPVGDARFCGRGVGETLRLVHKRAEARHHLFRTKVSPGDLLRLADMRGEELGRVVRAVAVALLDDAVELPQGSRRRAVRREVLALERAERLARVPHPPEREEVLVVVHKAAIVDVLRDVESVEEPVLLLERAVEEPREAVVGPPSGKPLLGEGVVEPEAEGPVGIRGAPVREPPHLGVVAQRVGDPVAREAEVDNDVRLEPEGGSAAVGVVGERRDLPAGMRLRDLPRDGVDEPEPVVGLLRADVRKLGPVLALAPLASAERLVVHRLDAADVPAPRRQPLVEVVAYVRDGLLQRLGVRVAELRRALLAFVSLREKLGAVAFEFRARAVPEAVVPSVERVACVDDLSSGLHPPQEKPLAIRYLLEGGGEGRIRRERGGIGDAEVVRPAGSAGLPQLGGVVASRCAPLGERPARAVPAPHGKAGVSRNQRPGVGRVEPRHAAVVAEKIVYRVFGERAAFEGDSAAGEGDARLLWFEAVRKGDRDGAAAERRRGDDGEGRAGDLVEVFLEFAGCEADSLRGIRADDNVGEGNGVFGEAQAGGEEGRGAAGEGDAEK